MRPPPFTVLPFAARDRLTQTSIFCAKLRVLKRIFAPPPFVARIRAAPCALLTVRLILSIGPQAEAS
jgi:hypothetical protein